MARTEMTTEFDERTMGEDMGFVWAVQRGTAEEVVRVLRGSLDPLALVGRVPERGRDRFRDGFRVGVRDVLRYVRDGWPTEYLDCDFYEINRRLGPAADALLL